jgi:methylenetetrahydrofolate dehydrogenase (NADP+)/methenyltetrahydrofolate cyclohydrolase
MLLDGKATAAETEETLRREIATLNGRAPCLAVILVGQDPASAVYVNTKKRACARVGIRSVAHELGADCSAEELLGLIGQLNNDPEVDGILCQLPLPAHLSEQAVIEAIHPDKDVDGFHPMNSGRLLNGDPDAFVPCTPLAVQKLLQQYHIDICGKHVVIIGRSNIVGKPLAALLMQNAEGANATVTVVHSRSKQLKALVKEADVIIPALGRPGFLTAEMVKEGAIVVDVGINRVDADTAKGYRIVGDADFASLESKCAWISPVPGGVGPMTVAILLNNTLIGYKRTILKSPAKQS